MSDNRRGRLFVLVGLACVVVGLAIAALLPGPVEPGSTGPGFGPGPVSPGAAVTPAWAEVAGLVPGVEPNAANPCQAGRPGCLDVVVAEMEARLASLGCAHTAPFAFTYLEMTREVTRSVNAPDFFLAPAVVAQLDALFARLYFDAIDNWSAGRRGDVPPVWQMAFQAADGGGTSAAADLFLGMNAHISRDLAYAVAQLLGSRADLFDDSTDFLLVNEVIAEVQDPMLEGAAARFDPRLTELTSLLPPEAGVTSVDLIAHWRQQAFVQGTRLASASTAEERSAVAAEIERTAVAGAVMILNADSTLAAEGSQLDRDVYCEAGR